MISFDEFVGTVFTQLKKRFPGVPHSQSMVDDALIATGIAALFEQETASGLPKKLFLRTLWINGHKRKGSFSGNETVSFTYRRHFETGVNGWISIPFVIFLVWRCLR